MSSLAFIYKWILNDINIFIGKKCLNTLLKKKGKNIFPMSRYKVFLQPYTCNSWKQIVTVEDVVKKNSLL